jgi:hypothetical protein
MEGMFRDFWWLMFPIFGMLMVVSGAFNSERRTKNVIDLIKTYTNRGQEPPAELLRLAAKDWDEDSEPSTPQSRRRNWIWTFFLLAGVAAGNATGYAFVSPTEDWAWVFLAAAVTTAVMAVGALVMLAVGGKS